MLPKETCRLCQGLVRAVTSLSPAMLVGHTVCRPKALEDVFPVGVGDSGYHLGDAKEILGNLATVIFRLSSGVVTATASQPSMPAERRLLMSMGKAHGRDAAEIRAELGQVLRAGINQHHVMARFVQGFLLFCGPTTRRQQS